jgi:hypothetical protein
VALELRVKLLKGSRQVSSRSGGWFGPGLVSYGITPTF